jgi:hypothetical protein
VILDMVYNHASTNDNRSRQYDGNDVAYNRDSNGNFLVLVSHSLEVPTGLVGPASTLAHISLHSLR